jgi:hypothetical protein
MGNSTPAGGPERVVASADGVFAIAVTLLVLDFSGVVVFSLSIPPAWRVTHASLPPPAAPLSPDVRCDRVKTRLRKTPASL